VDAGALEFRGSSLDVTPPTVTSVTPAGVTGATAFQIRVAFSEEPNPIDALAPAEYQLRDAGPDGTFGTADDGVYTLTPHFTFGTNFVLLDVLGGVALNRVYRLTVAGNSNTAIHDLAGLRLNGDFVQTGIVGLPGVTVSPVGVSVAEGGAGATVSVVLASPPTADVTITLNPGPYLTASPTTLTFTAANWNVPQTVTVAAMDDAYYEGTHTGTIHFTAASADVRYQGIAIPDVTATIADNDTPPQIEVVQVNDGSDQWSMVMTLQVKFDRVVMVDAGAFELTQTGPNGGPVTVTAVMTVVNGKSVATLTFSGGLVEDSGSLSDGRYQLKVKGDKVHDLGGVALDGDVNGLPGGDDAVSLFRLFGDVNGDATVDAATDFAQFSNAFGQSAGSPRFNAAFDYNGDGTIDSATDFAAFSNRFGRSI
jgi:hypothetical protein